MKQLFFRIAGLISGIAIIASLINAHILAESKPTGLTLSPVFQQVTINSSQASVPAKFTLINNNQTTVTLDLSIADLNTLSESGGLFISGTNPSELQRQYGLASWAQLATNQISLAPKQSATVAVNILNQATLTPGGHYGALMISQANSSGNSGQNSIGLKPIASALIFVTKIGGDTYKLALQKVTFHNSLFSLPSLVTLQFYNSGNTHVIPRGVISILKGNTLVSKGIVNQNSVLVLPQTHRNINVDLKSITSTLAPGKYKLVINYRFDGYDQFRTYQTTLMVIPKSIFIILGLALAFGLIIWRFRETISSKLKFKK